jgi:hypothetical protein
MLIHVRDHINNFNTSEGSLSTPPGRTWIEAIGKDLNNPELKNIEDIISVYGNQIRERKKN